MKSQELEQRFEPVEVHIAAAEDGDDDIPRREGYFTVKESSHPRRPGNYSGTSCEYFVPSFA